jgi:excisionase family DNA binding protein
MSKNLTDYVTTKQAAEMLGVLQTSIAHLLYNKKIKGIKLGGMWLIYLPSLEHYLANKSPGGRPRSGIPQIQSST